LGETQTTKGYLQREAKRRQGGEVVGIQVQTRCSLIWIVHSFNRRVEKVSSSL